MKHQNLLFYSMNPGVPLICLIVWPLFQAFSQHKELALLFLEYTLSILHKEPVTISSSEKGDITSESSADDCILQATMFALNAFVRYWLPFWLLIVDAERLSTPFLTWHTSKYSNCSEVVGRLGNKQLSKVTLLFFLALYWSWGVFMVLLSWAEMNFYGNN